MTKPFKVVFSTDAELDFELIFDFLYESYLSFDEDIETAIEQAEKKTQSIRKAVDKLEEHPFRGTLHDDMLQGLRHVTISRAIYWFDILEDKRLVRILAIFYGGQDHHTKMLIRLLDGK
ncbi:MAG: plasmid stabilization protein [Robiginitomaculum sp.]|nr:MAG: plasmid stabilization protein [Robiginitomaculum sp.]PHQ67025.1 MAG: plasmid stabilization protein [Robiginitomaculum sp.]